MEQHDSDRTGPLVTRVPAVVWAALLVLAVLATRSTVEQWQAYGRAVALEHEGRVRAAVQEYRWTLRWYTPWGPVHADAAEALLQIAGQHEAADPEVAVQALDGLRSGLIAGRSFFQPRAALLQQANERLPALLVRVAQRRGDKRDPQALLARFTADYQRPVGVAAWASMLVSLGFTVWVAGLLMAFRRGVDSAGRWTPAGWRWVGISGAGFACWALAMWLA